MSYRLKITLPDPTLTQLRAHAQQRGEPLARTATQLITAALSGAGGRSDDDARPSANSAAPSADDGPDIDSRAHWLEPYEDAAQWRAQMWASISVLHARYPRELANLQEGWWKHTALIERLCALVAWRDWIDWYAKDPREELAFQAELVHFGRQLREGGGGVSTAWEPGAPPSEWTG